MPLAKDNSSIPGPSGSATQSNKKVTLEARIKKINDLELQEGTGKVQSLIALHEQDHTLRTSEMPFLQDDFSIPGTLDSVTRSNMKDCINTIVSWAARLENILDSVPQEVNVKVQSPIALHKEDSKPWTSVMSLLQDDSSTSGQSGSATQSNEKLCINSIVQSPIALHEEDYKPWTSVIPFLQDNSSTPCSLGSATQSNKKADALPKLPHRKEFTKSLIPVRRVNQKYEKQVLNKVWENAKATGILKQRTTLTRDTTEMNRKWFKKAQTDRRFELQMGNRRKPK